MTSRRGSQYSIQSDGAGLRSRIKPSKGKRKGKIPSGTESTQGNAISQRQVPEMPIISEPELKLKHPGKVPQRGGNSEILQWMESTIIQTSDQKEGGKQGRSPSSFYQQASSQPTSPRMEEEQEKELE
ncbi:hypothetical protein O181_063446 [Austropuccinia psidii MF-1]|uniref:Uncharacterized protein n=1 Tax=Austropuccinia psidii MF-1 TaxID=1389203 RepID=A0A9Q3ERT2_9BASI|nr:hypothetical protein [Austropuccinia psidii MF-1]